MFYLDGARKTPVSLSFPNLNRRSVYPFSPGFLMKDKPQANTVGEDLASKCDLLEEKNRELVARIRVLSEQNRHNESLLHILLENTPFGMVMFDDKQRVLQINKAGETLLGIQRVNIIGKSCEVVFNCFADNRQRCPVLHDNKILDRVETDCRSTLCDCDRHLLRSVVRIDDQNETMLVEAFVDISPIKQAQREIENANQTKDNFLAKVSHELRTPLNAILGFSDLLRDSISAETDPDNSLYLDNIFRSSKNLLRMVDEVLDITRITAHRLTLDEYEVEVSGVLQQVCMDLAEQCEEQHNTLTVSCSDEILNIYTDPFRLHQILYHLLDNACKFTRQGEIDMRIYKDTYDGVEGIAFVVRDTGEGMSAEQQARVFTEFEQADTGSTRQHNGAGLGLTLCKKMTELMGGEIKVKSELGMGSEFTLWLPDKQPVSSAV